jgi:amino acid permease
VTQTTASRNAPLTVTAGLIILGVVCAVLGVIYLTETAAHLPSFLPGHQAGSPHHHTKHAVAAFALALLSWVGAWFTTGTRRRTSAS